MKYKNHVKYLFVFLFTAYIFLLCYLVFFSSSYDRDHFRRDLSLIPFKSIIFYLTAENSKKEVVINILGNILAFGPMGFLLPLVSPKAKQLLQVVTFCALASFSIELVQYIAAVGSSDIDDIILNVIGGILGFLLYIILVRPSDTVEFLE